MFLSRQWVGYNEKILYLCSFPPTVTVGAGKCTVGAGKCTEVAGVAAATSAPRSLSYNPAENAVLLGTDADNGSYELYIVPKDGKGDASPVSACLSRTYSSPSALQAHLYLTAFGDDHLYRPWRNAAVNQHAASLHL